jgi:hypothetical protein
MGSESVRNWKYRSEADLASAALGELGRYFTADREVRGVHCTGKRLRLDAVLRPRDPSGWFDPPPVFGVEFKNALAGSLDTRRFTSWAAQAVDYAHTDWEGYGRLMIFTCPAVFGRIRQRHRLRRGSGPPDGPGARPARGRRTRADRLRMDAKTRPVTRIRAGS